MSQFAEIDFAGFFDRGVDRSQEGVIREALGKLCTNQHIEHIPADTSMMHMAFLALKSMVRWKPVTALKYFRAGMANVVKHWVEKTKYDVVHIDMLPLAEYTSLFGSTPVVLTNHNVESLRLKRWADSETSFVKRAFLTLQARMTKTYEKSVMRSLKYCVTVSDYDRDYLRDFNPNCRFFVVPNGTDVNFYTPRTVPHERPTMLWVGGMHDPYNRRGVEFFVENVFPKVHRAVPDLHWIVVGKSPPPSLLALKTRYPDAVALEGFVEDVRDFYGRADVFVVPLLSGSGTKLKVIEGLAMGMPIVTTTIGAEGLAVTDGVEMAIRDDADKFAESVIRLLQSREQRDVMASEARDVAESRYDWTVIGQLQKQAYQEALEAKTTSCAE